MLRLTQIRFPIVEMTRSQIYRSSIGRSFPPVIYDRIIRSVNSRRAGLSLSPLICADLHLNFPFMFVPLFLCGLLSVVRPAFAEFDKTQWQFSKPVEASAPSDGYLRVSIDGEVYRHSQRSLSDLRLVDDQSKEVGYSIHAQRESTIEESYEPKIFNRAVLPGSYSTLTLDLEQEVESNTLVVRTSSRNFKRRVEIAGSNDRKQWFVLKADGYIFDFSGDQKIHLTTIKYPDTKYRYLQVKVWNAKEEPLTIEGASLSRVKTTPARRIVRTVSLHSRDEDAKLKVTTCVLDLSYDNLPADFLMIDTPEENFFRTVEIQGSNDLKTWDSPQQGSSTGLKPKSMQSKRKRCASRRCGFTI